MEQSYDLSAEHYESIFIFQRYAINLLFRIEPLTSMVVHVNRQNYVTGAFSNLAYFGVRLYRDL